MNSLSQLSWTLKKSHWHFDYESATGERKLATTLGKAKALMG